MGGHKKLSPKVNLAENLPSVPKLPHLYIPALVFTDVTYEYFIFPAEQKSDVLPKNLKEQHTEDIHYLKL